MYSLRPFQLANIILVLSLIVLDITYLLGYTDWWWLLVVLGVYIHALVFGSIYIQWNFYVKSYNSGSNSDRSIAITFDDGPAAQTERILDILKEHSVQAAFFSIGKNAVAHPQLIKRWYAEGHLIGNHSYNHSFNFDWQSSKSMTAEIEQTNAAIQAIAGVRPLCFRPPYGVTNPNLAKAIRNTGMQSIGWNIRSFDTKAKDPEALLQRLLGKLKGGDIVLLHDSMPITAEILTEFIIQARKKGFTFARVDTLLGIDAYA